MKGRLIKLDDYERLMIAPVQKRRTFEEVSDKIKELIFNGTLEPGQKLPSEQALAQLFQVGRQSVREALRLLELSGFISVRRGTRGSAVIEGTMLSKISGVFLDTIKLHKVSLEDCLKARKAIEASVIEHVIENASDSDIEKLHTCVAVARSKLTKHESTYEENIDFHRILARISGVYTFSIVMESIMAVFSDLKSRRSAVTEKQSKSIIEAHAAIVAALAARDKKAAVAMLENDLKKVEQILLGGSDQERLPP